MTVVILDLYRINYCLGNMIMVFLCKGPNQLLFLITFFKMHSPWDKEIVQWTKPLLCMLDDWVQFLAPLGPLALPQVTPTNTEPEVSSSIAGCSPETKQI